MVVVHVLPNDHAWLLLTLMEKKSQEFLDLVQI